MNLLIAKTSERSYLNVSSTQPIFASVVKEVNPSIISAIRSLQDNTNIFNKLIQLLGDKPNYDETVVYKLLELPLVATQSGVLLVTNSYNMRLSNTLVQQIVDLLN